MKEKDLKERLFTFTIEVLKMLQDYRSGKELEVIKYQLSRSATSRGANYEEAQAAISKADFISKVSISLKEIRETCYWLRIVQRLSPQTKDIDVLVKESEELSKILASILIKSRTN